MVLELPLLYRDFCLAGGSLAALPPGVRQRLAEATPQTDNAMLPSEPLPPPQSPARPILSGRLRWWSGQRRSPVAPFGHRSPAEPSRRDERLLEYPNVKIRP